MLFVQDALIYAGWRLDSKLGSTQAIRASGTDVAEAMAGAKRRAVSLDSPAAV
jgi:hypothetical protein